MTELFFGELRTYGHQIERNVEALAERIDGMSDSRDWSRKSELDALFGDQVPELESQVRNLHNFASNSLSFANLLETCFALYEQNERHMKRLQPILAERFGYSDVNRQISNSNHDASSSSGSDGIDQADAMVMMKPTAQLLESASRCPTATSAMNSLKPSVLTPQRPSAAVPRTPTLNDFGISSRTIEALKIDETTANNNDESEATSKKLPASADVARTLEFGEAKKRRVAAAAGTVPSSVVPASTKPRDPRWATAGETLARLRTPARKQRTIRAPQSYNVATPSPPPPSSNEPEQQDEQQYDDDDDDDDDDENNDNNVNDASIECDNNNNNIEYVDDSDLAKAPSYLKIQCNCSQLNEFIDKINNRLPLQPSFTEAELQELGMGSKTKAMILILIRTHRLNRSKNAKTTIFTPA